jgi:hypothetical protein
MLSFPRRHWRLCLLLSLLALCAIAVAVVVLRRNQLMREADERLATAVAQTDAEDPRWRWEDILEDRAEIPDEQNGALVVTSAAELFPD